jgi:hypothetical protein
MDSILGHEMKRLRRRIYNALWSLNHWLNDDDDRNTYFVCALVFVAGLAFAASADRFETPSQYAIHSATPG